MGSERRSLSAERAAEPQEIALRQLHTRGAAGWRIHWFLCTPHG